MADEVTQVFEAVASSLEADPDDDVTRDGDVLLVKGRRFAALEGRRLIVDLPAARADDLIRRGIAVSAPGSAHAGGARVAVVDQEDWLELATEAHQFVGEPPVGRDS